MEEEDEDDDEYGESDCLGVDCEEGTCEDAEEVEDATEAADDDEAEVEGESCCIAFAAA